MSRFRSLSDPPWSSIGELLPGPTGRPGRKFSDARTMVEAIVYRYRTGVAWRDRPEVLARGGRSGRGITRTTGGWIELPESGRRAA